MRSGQDPNRFIVRDPDTETRLMQDSCPPDEPTSLTFVQTRGRTVRVRIGVVEAQKSVGFVSSKFVTNTNEPDIPGIAFEGDCDLVDVQYAEAQPMWRSSRNARFPPLGKRVIMRNEAPLRSKIPLAAHEEQPHRAGWHNQASDRCRSQEGQVWDPVGDRLYAASTAIRKDAILLRRCLPLYQQERQADDQSGRDRSRASFFGVLVAGSKPVGFGRRLKRCSDRSSVRASTSDNDSQGA